MSVLVEQARPSPTAKKCPQTMFSWAWMCRNASQAAHLLARVLHALHALHQQPLLERFQDLVDLGLQQRRQGRAHSGGQATSRMASMLTNTRQGGEACRQTSTRACWPRTCCKLVRAFMSRVQMPAGSRQKTRNAKRGKRLLWHDLCAVRACRPSSCRCKVSLDNTAPGPAWTTHASPMLPAP